MNRASFFKQLIIILDVTKSNGFLLPLASSYEDLAGRFQLALYRHNNSGGEPIYEADEMEQIAHTHAPTLLTQLLNSITPIGTVLRAKKSKSCKEKEQLLYCI